MKLSEMLSKEEDRRKGRNIKDRLARKYIRDHPEIKEDPEGLIDPENIPEGTTESGIRGIARFYHKKKMIRTILRERKNDNTRGTEETKRTESCVNSSEDKVLKSMDTA